jgi:hypothetical protein
MAEKKEKVVNMPGAAPSGGLRYVGDGSYLPNVPARDLTAEEAAEHAARYGASATWAMLYAPFPVDEVKQEE